jgi:hypothetical protein
MAGSLDGDGFRIDADSFEAFVRPAPGTRRPRIDRWFETWARAGDYSSISR